MQPPVSLSQQNTVTDAGEAFVECTQDQNNGGQEDCLYLAVYVPIGANSSSNLPVRQFIYVRSPFLSSFFPAIFRMKLKRAQGGAFETGGNQYYNGGGIALKYNTIVVVANYRLGLAGFFVSSGTVSEGSNGNYVRFYWR